jgi:hypothetical protein
VTFTHVLFLGVDHGLLPVGAGERPKRFDGLPMGHDNELGLLAAATLPHGDVRAALLGLDGGIPVSVTKRSKSASLPG